MIKELGRFPKFSDFKDSEYSSIPGAIKKFHGGIDFVIGCQLKIIATIC